HIYILYLALFSLILFLFFFFFSSRRRHTRSKRDWSSDVCSSDLHALHVRPSLDPALRDGGDGRGDACQQALGQSEVDREGRQVAAVHPDRGGLYGKRLIELWLGVDLDQHAQCVCARGPGERSQPVRG